MKQTKKKPSKKLKVEHNGPTAHVGPSGMHYGAHSGVKAITAQKGYYKGC